MVPPAPELLPVPPLELELEVPPADGVQVPFTQVPVQQSVLLAQVVPAPAVGVSGMQELQSEEMSQPVGQATLPQAPPSAAWLGEHPVEAARAKAATPKPTRDLRQRSI
jgi:hypothetical protein